MTEYEMYLSGMSLPQVHKETGIALSTLRFRFLKKGILRTRIKAVQLAASQGRMGSGFRGKHPVFTQQHKDNIQHAAQVRGERDAKGTSVKPSGYIEITRGPNKGRSVHDVLMEQHLGRSLQKNELVHHKNENRSDNRLENLELLTRGQHTSLHISKNHRLGKYQRDSLGRFTRKDNSNV